MEEIKTQMWLDKVEDVLITALYDVVVPSTNFSCLLRSSTISEIFLCNLQLETGSYQLNKAVKVECTNGQSNSSLRSSSRPSSAYPKPFSLPPTFLSMPQVKNP
jgi:hypothetical protein